MNWCALPALKMHTDTQTQFVSLPLNTIRSRRKIHNQFDMWTKQATALAWPRQNGMSTCTRTKCQNPIFHQHHTHTHAHTVRSRSISHIEEGTHTNHLTIERKICKFLIFLFIAKRKQFPIHTCVHSPIRFSLSLLVYVRWQNVVYFRKFVRIYCRRKNETNWPPFQPDSVAIVFFCSIDFRCYHLAQTNKI